MEIGIKDITRLLERIQLEQIDTNIFKGESQNTGNPSIFGGQVLAQALDATQQTVTEDRLAHSFHGYFLRPGDWSKPVRFEVDRVRDGRSFSVRRVDAIQNDKIIFTGTLSFQIHQAGFEHQIDMPLNVPSPDSLVDDCTFLTTDRDKLSAYTQYFLSIPRPIEFRTINALDTFQLKTSPSNRSVWIRTRGTINSDDVRVHQKILSYISDYHLFTTALLPHKGEPAIGQLHITSLDHAIWFHQAFRADEWLLYVVDSPKAHNSRGFTRGSFYTEDGRLVASATQEGLMRKF